MPLKYNMSWYCETSNDQIVCRCRELNVPGVIQAISTKTSGNMALHTGDNPEMVVERRQRFLKGLGLNLSQLVAGAQTHGVNVQVVSKESGGSGAFDLNTVYPDTDALITQHTGVVLSTYTADCLPIFIYDPVTPAIGLVHAGWRGTIYRILAKTLEKMNSVFQTVPSQCIVAIGPAICPSCFKVTEEVAIQFAEVYPESVRNYIDNHNYLVDLVGFNKWILGEFGVPAQHIVLSEWCTSCSKDQFYSYRADRETIGRMMGIISLLEETKSI